MFTRISTAWVFTCAAIAAVKLGVSDMSAITIPWWAWELPSNSARTVRNFSGSRAKSVTAAPQLASSMAVARPMPCVLPHTKALRPVNELFIGWANKVMVGARTAICTKKEAMGGE